MNAASSQASGSESLPLKLAGMSVVLIGEANNPTILNPDFLRLHVVGSERQLKEPPICTPVFARVSYRDGISVQSEPNRVGGE